jgi:hypothetical protein
MKSGSYSQTIPKHPHEPLTSPDNRFHTKLAKNTAPRHEQARQTKLRSRTEFQIKPNEISNSRNTTEAEATGWISPSTSNITAANFPMAAIPKKLEKHNASQEIRSGKQRSWLVGWAFLPL